MPRFYIWTIGCQMNKAESGQIGEHLAQFGYKSTTKLREADLVVLNTCVVRQAAEEKVLGTLGYLKGIKSTNPHLSILVTGCFVSSRIEALKTQFLHVDLFFKPGVYSVLLEWLRRQVGTEGMKAVAKPSVEKIGPTAFVPIIQGCNNFCSYCVVPYRRGREKSRLLDEVVCEVHRLAGQGIREVTLLGQNVNSYGHDLQMRPTLCDLLTELDGIKGLARIRFLTNHPKDMTQELIKAIACLDKVCEHITLPFQSGDDGILRAMRRGYTTEQYRNLVHTIRDCIPEVALSTDVIVGFPRESEEQFGRTLSLLEEIGFDAVHVAAYSPRPDTIALKKYEDDVPSDIKKDRLARVESENERIAGEINSRFLGKMVEVLVEGTKGGKWYGRTRSDKLVFFENGEDCAGRLLNIEIAKTSPWALQGFISDDGSCLEKRHFEHKVALHGIAPEKLTSSIGQ